MTSFTMFLPPALIALGFLWWNGRLPWMCWVVTIISILAWFCGRTALNWRNGLLRGRYTDVQAFRGWELIASLAIWAQWIVCAIGIILALVVKRAS